GTLFASVLLNLMNNGEVVNEQTLPKVLPRVVSFYDRLGFLESSSAYLFENYLSTGMGENPIIVGYENQLVEFAHARKADWEQAKRDVAMLYPVPTVWSDHTFMATSENGKRLFALFSDSDVKKLSAEEHGFRVEGEAPPKVAGIAMRKSIDAIIPLPRVDVIQEAISQIP
ncbi:MAG: hypothetical protein ACRC5C_10080, partial [Bacilli bacterium]